MIKYIKALWQLKKVLNYIKKESSKEVKMNNGAKAGYKTTEFWLTLTTNVIAVVEALKGVIPPETALIVMAVLNGIYTTLRTIAKK